MHNERKSGPSADELRVAILDHLRYSLGRGEHRRPQAPDLHRAAALAVRDVLVDGLLRSARRQQESGVKRVCYLSMEFLLGRSLENNLQNLGLLETFREALGDMCEPDEVIATEPDAGLGNGGLGRLAACYLDSMATLGLAGTGYGISYEFGMFRQEIDRGRQREKPDRWMAGGTPWLVERTDESCIVPAYGRVEDGVDRDGHYNPLWMDWRTLVGVPHDMSIVGWRGRTVNRLRLFAARASDDFDTAIFNEGDYIRAVEQKVASETVSKVLYPSDRSAAGRELRLLQEYFLVACALRDIVRRELSEGADLRELPRRVAIQLNDTHPALAVVELMRILVDEHGLDWDSAWKATVGTCAYTNHTLMPEALETWPVTLIEKVLPRHLQVLYEVNRRFLDGEVAERWPGDGERRRRMSLVGEEGERHVRMANLAIVGSHAVNGVAALHSDLIRTRLVPDFAALWPERFSNKTNGVTPRRWLRVANPGLASLVTRALGDERWVSDLERLRGLERFSADGSFREEFRGIKRAETRIAWLRFWREARVRCDPAALFDVQVKRIHEYKRQLLNVLQILADYLRIVEDGVGAPGSASLRDRRKGGSGLPCGEGDHPDHPWGGRGRQRRQAGARSAARGVRARLSGEPGGEDRAGRRYLAADIDCGDGGFGHQQHEAGAQRGLDSGDAGRSEHRDPRGRGGRELLPVRALDGRGPRDPGSRLRTGSLRRRLPGLDAGARAARERRGHPTRSGARAMGSPAPPLAAGPVPPPRRLRFVRRATAGECNASCRP